MKKLFVSLLCAVMMVTFMPSMAFAAVDGSEALAPTGNGVDFFANGTPVTISKEQPEDAVKAELEGFTCGGDTDSTAFISWLEAGVKKYVPVKKETVVFGGKDGSNSAVNVPSTEITMTGGTVWRIYGGNLGKNNDFNNEPSTVGDVKIHISGGDSLVCDILHGGGRYNSAVTGHVTLTLDGVNFVDKTYANGVYICGGTHGNGTEGQRNIDNGTMNTRATVSNVDINILNSKVHLVAAGGSGSTKVNNSNVKITNSEVTALYMGGVNGETVSSKLDITGNSKIERLSATNRGFVGTGTASIGQEVAINTLSTGASSGCFSSDSGTPDGSGVTGIMTWNIADGATVTKAVLTPYVTKTTEKNVADFGGMVINKSGDPLSLTVEKFITNNKLEPVTEFVVSENKSLHLSGVDLTVDNGVGAFENKGTIELEKGSSLVDKNNTINDNGVIEVSPDSTVSTFVTAQDFNLWGADHKGWYNVGWKYADGFNTDLISKIVVGIQDIDGKDILTYTATGQQLLYQKNNGYINGNKESSAPFYKEVPEGEDLDWSVKKGEAFEDFAAAKAYVEVFTTSVPIEKYNKLSYTSAHKHVWSDWVVKKEPTTTDSGLKERKCTDANCIAKQSEIIEPSVPSIPSIPGGTTVQKPTIEHDAHATVTLSKDGTTATITVAEGYELADVVLNGKSLGKKTTVTDLKTGDKLVVTTVKKPAEFDVAAALDSLKLTARSSKTSKKNIKVVVKMDDQLKAAVEELKANGYTVKYKFYRSVKKASGYQAKLTKDAAVYTNTAGKKGTMYYYKARLQVFNAAGEFVDQTELKQCKYANRRWTK